MISRDFFRAILNRLFILACFTATITAIKIGRASCRERVLRLV